MFALHGEFLPQICLLKCGVKLTAFCKAISAALCMCACGKKFLNHCNFNVKLFLSELQEIEWYNTYLTMMETSPSQLFTIKKAP